MGAEQWVPDNAAKTTVPPSPAMFLFNPKPNGGMTERSLDVGGVGDASATLMALPAQGFDAGPSVPAFASFNTTSSRRCDTEHSLQGIHTMTIAPIGSASNQEDLFSRDSLVKQEHQLTTKPPPNSYSPLTGLQQDMTLSNADADGEGEDMLAVGALPLSPAYHATIRTRKVATGPGSHKWTSQLPIASRRRKSVTRSFAIARNPSRSKAPYEDATHQLRPVQFRHTIPLSLNLKTEARASQRALFDQATEENRKKIQEDLRLSREAKERITSKELRERATFRARELPKWYRDAPRKRS